MAIGNERVRVILEGGYLEQQIQREHETLETFGSGPFSVTKGYRQRVTVDSPERIWVQSLDPEEVRKRISGQNLNPDAILIQEKLDKAEAEIKLLRGQIKKMRAGYDFSKSFWKKNYKNKPWLVHASMEDLQLTIEQGEPEQDYDEWDD